MDRVASEFLFFSLFFLSRFSYNFSEIVSLRRVKVSRCSGVFSAGERDFHDFHLLIDREDPKGRLRSTNLFNLSPFVSLYLRAVSVVSYYGITVSEEHVRIVLAEVREARGAKKPRSIAHQ